MDEPLAGTAPQARVWVAVEQPGPWGPRPVTDPADSHLPAAVREALAAADALADVKTLVVRRPGRHADPPEATAPRQVLLACVAPEHRFVVSTTCRSTEELVDLDLASAAAAAVAGRTPDWGEAVRGPVTFVCTNGRRDRCCALAGRPVAAHLATERPTTVWECNHLGGHRFAPTALVLPAGAVYGGLDGPELAHAVAGLEQSWLTLTGLRGLSVLTPVQQVADVAARRVAGIDDLDATSPQPARTGEGGDVRVTVGTADRRVEVLVREVARPDRPESCGKTAVPRTDLVADVLA